jgi:hypothetical protein
MRWLTRIGRRDEHGAVVVIMVVFTVVIVVMAALVVDIGGLLDERRQLQNGADASALAVAHSCALGACDTTQASAFANANARDSHTTVDSVTVSGNLVTVLTSTKAANGDTILPYWFAQALGSEKGKTAHAKAVAKWAPLGRATATRLAVSQCDVSRLGISTVVSVIMFHSNSSSCDGSSGHDTSGAFGWLDADGSGNACELTVSASQTATADTGTSGPTKCLDPYLNKDILIPVFDDVVGITGTGTKAVYTVKGFARFHLTGYRFGGKKTTPVPCSGSTDCIAGYFVRYVTASQVLGDISFGVSSVNLVS